MKPNPLQPPEDSWLLSTFLAHVGISAHAEPRQMLRNVAAAFAGLPYENLTKIIKQAELGRPDQARRTPAEVIKDHRLLGTGGTCFSLTATLLHLLRAVGWQAEPILADRRYGQNTHCALLVWIDRQPHLLDPGYLIVDPIPIQAGATRRVTTAFNSLVLAPQPAGHRWDLYTVQQGKQTYRLTFKTRPVDAGQFLAAWDASFDWDMMRYPLLTRVCGSQQLYLHDQLFQVREREAVNRRELARDEVVQRIAHEFGIHPSVAARALSILDRKGKAHGPTSNR